MAAYLVSIIHEITDPASYARYTARVPELVARHGGDYVVRTTDVVLVEGEEVPQRVLVVGFPDRSAIEAMFDDPDYLEVADLRRRSTRGTIFTAAGG